MPFTADEFLDVFAAYNTTLWVPAWALCAFTAAVFVPFVAGARVRMPLLMLLLAGHWFWAGLLYHALFFTAVNPAAWVFAALFVLQGVLFVVTVSSRGMTAACVGSWRHVVSSSLILYSLVYPAIAWADGFVYPRMPTFGVPCPTVILTIGFLVALAPSSVLLSIIPVAWSLIGVSAVWLFGVHADLVLPAAGALLVVDLIWRRSHVMKKLSVAGIHAVLIAMLLFVPASTAFAQADQHDHTQHAAEKSGMKMDGKMMDEMAAKKKANTARIATLMGTVRSATGEAKVAAMADVVAVLLEERAAMQEHCATMMAMMKK